VPSKKYNWKKYNKTAAMERQYRTYPPQKYFHLLENYRVANEMGKSETLNFIIRHFFDSLPSSEIERIRSVSAMNTP
jgi:hypothetical protein